VTPKATLLLLFVASGAVLIGISIPLVRGRVPPNPYYGVRVGRTREDPEVWYRVNAYAGRLGLRLGAVTIAVSVALSLIPGLTVAAYAWAVGAVAVAGVVLLVILTLRSLGRAAGSRAP
jgi:uncharacterized membrane protein